MRRILLSDVIHLATALAAQETPARGAVLDQWIDQTRAAAKYQRRFGRPHRHWGDGSLTSRAILASIGRQGHKVPAGQGEFLSALALVANALSGVGHSPRQ
ncbi:MAG: DUF7742 family protein [Paracoccaceae bacterium]